MVQQRERERTFESSGLQMKMYCCRWYAMARSGYNVLYMVDNSREAFRGATSRGTRVTIGIVEVGQQLQKVYKPTKVTSMGHQTYYKILESIYFLVIIISHVVFLYFPSLSPQEQITIGMVGLFYIVDLPFSFVFCVIFYLLL